MPIVLNDVVFATDVVMETAFRKTVALVCRPNAAFAHVKSASQWYSWMKHNFLNAVYSDAVQYPRAENGILVSRL